jgi:hypothetical protein
MGLMVIVLQRLMLTPASWSPLALGSGWLQPSSKLRRV